MLYMPGFPALIKASLTQVSWGKVSSVALPLGLRETPVLHQSCSGGMQTAPPQNSTLGLLMCLSPQVHSLMWRDWFLNGCFSSQRNTYFQSLIRKLLSFARRRISHRTQTSWDLPADEKLLICTTLAYLYFSLLVDNSRTGTWMAIYRVYVLVFSTFLYLD